MSTPKISELTEEQIRELVAESLGWKHYGCTGCACSPCRCQEWIHESGDFGPCFLPSYTTDLNACHEMEKTLTGMERFMFISNLGSLTLNIGIYRPEISATAFQRASSYLLTRNLATA